MTAAVASRPRVLCVDDEPNVLAGFQLHLRRHYDVVTAANGAAALEILRADTAFAVVLSDMRMPGIDGAAMLAQAVQLAPTATRILLTGQADLASAIAAINEGRIFRFLHKPCPPATLVATIAEAAEQHRLVTAEKVLLEQTLHGCVKALSDVLAIASPSAMGRALRIKRHVSDLAAHAGDTDRWQAEMAAMFSQVGMITLPADTAERVRTAQPLTPEEEAMVQRIPAFTSGLLANIPRLETVREILAAAGKVHRPIEPGMDAAARIERRGAHLLRIATDFDTHDSRGLSASAAIGALRARADAYDPALLDALEELRVAREERAKVREVRISALRTGMIFAEDVRLVNGSLLVARGYEVTDRFVERLANVMAGHLKEPLRVTVPDELDAAS